MKYSKHSRYHHRRVVRLDQVFRPSDDRPLWNPPIVAIALLFIVLIAIVYSSIPSH